MKSPVVLILTLFMSFSLDGQITFGLSGGVNFSSAKLKDSHAAVEKGYIGIHAGINAKYQLTKIIYLSLDAQFSEKGHQPDGQHKFYLPVPSGRGKTTFKNQYIDLIPELEFRIQNWLSVGLGAQYAYFLENIRKVEGENWVVQTEYSSVKERDYGLTASLRFYIGKIFSTVRYNYGLEDINTADLFGPNGTKTDQKQYNRNFQIGVGYNLLPLKVEKKPKGPWY